MNRSLTRGLTLVEVLIGTAIIVTFLVSLFTVHSLYLKSVFSASKTASGTYLAQEAVEAVRFLRDSSWTDNIVPLAKNTEYELSFAGNTWSLVQTNTLIDGVFDRKIIFESVYRDVTAQIVPSGGSLDEGTVKLTVNVAWASGAGTTTKTFSTYITNLLEEEE